MVGIIASAWSIFFTVVIGICLCLYLYNRRRVYTLPPGPIGWPIIGNLTDIVTNVTTGKPLHDFLTSMSLKYGPIFSCNILGKRFVILNDFDSIREGFIVIRI